MVKLDSEEKTQIQSCKSEESTKKTKADSSKSEQKPAQEDKKSGERCPGDKGPGDKGPGAAVESKDGMEEVLVCIICQEIMHDCIRWAINTGRGPELVLGELIILTQQLKLVGNTYKTYFSLLWRCESLIIIVLSTSNCTHSIFKSYMYTTVCCMFHIFFFFIKKKIINVEV